MVQGDNTSSKAGLSAEEHAAGRAEMAELLEQYFKLDHEGEAGGHKTRFRYKQVPANTFGLSADDLLTMDDKELNQVRFVGEARDGAEGGQGGLAKGNEGWV